MIRFIYLGNQIGHELRKDFAFFNDTVERFITIGGRVVFTNTEQLKNHLAKSRMAQDYKERIWKSIDRTKVYPFQSRKLENAYCKGK